jgi:hypothetical protein
VAVVGVNISVGIVIVGIVGAVASRWWLAKNLICAFRWSRNGMGLG